MNELIEWMHLATTVLNLTTAAANAAWAATTAWRRFRRH